MTLYERVADSGCKTIALIGLAKNVGKTTAMNSLAAASRAAGERIAIASIGRDGESHDAVTGQPKPAVELFRGDRFVTTDRLISASGVDAIKELDLDVTSPLGRAGLYRMSSSRGSIVIAGINRVSAMIRVKEAALSLADRFYIDGAINRRSSGMPELADGIIVSTGAVLGGSCVEVAKKTSEAISVLSLPGLPSIPGKPADQSENLKPRPILHKGALTDKIALELLSKLPTDGAETILAVADPTKIFLSQRTIKILAHRRIVLKVIKPLNILGITVNPHNPIDPDLQAKELERAVREAVTPIVVYDVKK